MHMQIVVGLKRLGHDVYYFETTSSWPYDPVRQCRVSDSDYALPYLAHIAKSFGVEDSWAYRRSYSDKEWFGISQCNAEEMLTHADMVLNISGATRFAEEGLKVGRLIYFGTDPGYHEIMYANGDEDIVTLINEHDIVVTYGENIGTKESGLPALPNFRATTRQPVLLDLWQDGTPINDRFTTVGNWKQIGKDIDYRGDTYYWSKHYEILKIIELPAHIDQKIELAMGLNQLSTEDRLLLESHGWELKDAHSFTTDPWPYRHYIQTSQGEFTVAKDQNVRLRSGWFSERSACYLAAGRPVITQDTGIKTILPTGVGLFAYSSMDEIIEAFEAISRDYTKHSQAALEISEEYFKAERVLANLLDELGF